MHVQFPRHLHFLFFIPLPPLRFFRFRCPGIGGRLSATTTTVASAVVVMTTFFRNVPGLVRDVTRRRRRRRPTSQPPSPATGKVFLHLRGGFRWRYRVGSTNMALRLRRMPGWMIRPSVEISEMSDTEKTTPIDRLGSTILWNSCP